MEAAEGCGSCHLVRIGSEIVPPWKGGSSKHVGASLSLNEVSPNFQNPQCYNFTAESIYNCFVLLIVKFVI